MSPCSTSDIASTTSRTGSEMERDTRSIARSPRNTDTVVSTRIGMSSDADWAMSQPLERHRINTAIAMLGMALLNTHIITSLAATLGAVSRPMKSLDAAATTGRVIFWVNSRLVLMLD